MERHKKCKLSGRSFNSPSEVSVRREVYQLATRTVDSPEGARASLGPRGLVIGSAKTCRIEFSDSLVEAQTQDEELEEHSWSEVQILAKRSSESCRREFRETVEEFTCGGVEISHRKFDTHYTLGSADAVPEYMQQTGLNTTGLLAQVLVDGLGPGERHEGNVRAVSTGN